jgi:hypothetical protein
VRPTRLAFLPRYLVLQRIWPSIGNDENRSITAESPSLAMDRR